jgi:hypothetical protein
VRRFAKKIFGDLVADGIVGGREDRTRRRAPQHRAILLLVLFGVQNIRFA